METVGYVTLTMRLLAFAGLLNSMFVIPGRRVRLPGAIQLSGNSGTAGSRMLPDPHVIPVRFC